MAFNLHKLPGVLGFEENMQHGVYFHISQDVGVQAKGWVNWAGLKSGSRYAILKPTLTGGSMSSSGGAMVHTSCDVKELEKINNSW